MGNAKHAATQGAGHGRQAPGSPPSPPAFVRVSVEKRRDQGEDAEPVAQEIVPGAYAVGAFDGLGGAGATMVNRGAVPRTSAFVASRLAHDVSLDTLKRALNPDIGSPAGTWKGSTSLGERLAADLKHQFRQMAEEVGGTSSRIRGGLIRPLPTTLALGLVHFPEGTPTLQILWAGDSRVYLLLPDSGLHQLTVDDLKSGGDAMSNLLDDSPMSNLVSADGRFVINNHHLQPMPWPAVVIAATDGCFGYLRTPTHFEDLLLNSMRRVSAHQNTTWESWGLQLTDELSRISGDDATMGMACLGWSSFQEMTAHFEPRQQQVRAMVAEVTSATRVHEQAQKEAEHAKDAYDRAVQGLWHAYKPGYEHMAQPTASAHTAAASATPPVPPAPSPPRPAGTDPGGSWSNPPTAGGHPAEPTGFGPAGALGPPGTPREKGGDDLTDVADHVQVMKSDRTDGGEGR